MSSCADSSHPFGASSWPVMVEQCSLCCQQCYCKGLFLCRYIHTEFPSPLMLATWPGLGECSAELFIIWAPAYACVHVRFPGEAWWGQRFFTVLLIWSSVRIGREVSKTYSEARADRQPFTSSLSLEFFLVILQVFLLKSFISKAKVITLFPACFPQ